MNIAFYAGHKHYLPHSRLLIQSIKKQMKNTEITVVVNQEDYAFYENELRGVILIGINIGHSYPYVDKIYAASIYEKTQNASFIWMDVDSYLNQPLYISEKKGIQCNVVDMKNVGVVYGERPKNLWKILFDHFEIDISSLKGVYTTISNQLIYPYYNLGLVGVHRQHCLFQKTSLEIDKLINVDVIKAMIDKDTLSKIFFHQMVFTCIVLKIFGEDDIHNLPSGYNFPLHLNHKLNIKKEISDLVSLRYDTYFEKKHEYTEDLPSDLYKMANKLSMLWYY